MDSARPPILAVAMRATAVSTAIPFAQRYVVKTSFAIAPESVAAKMATNELLPATIAYPFAKRNVDTIAFARSPGSANVNLGTRKWETAPPFPMDTRTIQMAIARPFAQRIVAKTADV